MYNDIDKLYKWSTFKGKYNQREIKKAFQDIFEEKVLLDVRHQSVKVPEISQEIKNEMMQKMKEEQNIRFAVHRKEWDSNFNRKIVHKEKKPFGSPKVLGRKEPRQNWKWAANLPTTQPPERPDMPVLRTSHHLVRWAKSYRKNLEAKQFQSRSFGYKSALMKSRQYLLKNAFYNHRLAEITNHKLDSGMETRIFYDKRSKILKSHKTKLSHDYRQKGRDDSHLLREAKKRNHQNHTKSDPKSQKREREKRKEKIRHALKSKQRESSQTKEMRENEREKI